MWTFREESVSAASHLLVLAQRLEAWRLHVVSPAAQPVVAFCEQTEVMRQTSDDWNQLQTIIRGLTLSGFEVGPGHGVLDHVRSDGAHLPF